MKSNDPRLHHRLVPAENHARLSGPVVEQPPSFPPADIPPALAIESSDSLGALVEALLAAYLIIDQARVNAAHADDMDLWFDLHRSGERLWETIAAVRRRASTGGNAKLCNSPEAADSQGEKGTDSK